jgi:hypothetical protein
MTAHRITMDSRSLELKGQGETLVLALLKGTGEIAAFPLSGMLSFSRGRPWDFCYAATGRAEICMRGESIGILIPGAFSGVEVRLRFYFDPEKGLVLESEWKNRGALISDAMAGLCFPMPWAEGAKFTLPHCLYNDNPSADPERVVPKVGSVPGAGYIAEEHRLPIPALNIQWKAGKEWPHFSIFSEPSPVAGDFDSFWSLGLLKGETGYTAAALSGGVMFNGEKDTVYAAKGGHRDYPYPYSSLAAGASWRKKHYLSWDKDREEGMGFRSMVREGWKIYRPRTKPAMSREKLTKLKHHCLVSRWYQDGEASGYLCFGSANDFGNISGRPDYFLYAWTGECLKLAWCDMVYGLRTGDPEAVERGIAAAAFFVRNSLRGSSGAPAAYYIVEEKRWGTMSHRAGGEAYSSRMTGSSAGDLLDIMELLKKEGRPVPGEWEAYIRRVMDFLTLPARLTDQGIYPLQWDGEGNPGSRKTTSAGIPCVIALAKGGSYFGKAEWLGYAEDVMERYYHLTAETMRYPFAYATMDARCEDKEAGMYFFIAAMELYRLTGKDRFLEWAGIAADWLLTFLYLWEPPLKPGSPCEKAGFRVSGWPGVSVQNHHLDVFFSPVELDEYGRARGDTMYRDCAQMVLDAWTHGICEKPGDWGFTVPGEQGEQYYQTNYSQARDSLNRLQDWRGGASNWNPSWIIAEVLSACLRLA